MNYNTIKVALAYLIYQVLISTCNAGFINQHVLAAPNEIIDRSPKPEPIDPQIYSNLFTYAHLIDISYCISKMGRIGKPFKCELNCERRFPNVTLVYQWYFDDSDCGYIATTYSNIFNYDDKKVDGKKTIIVSLRGTRSIFDTFADLKVDMTHYSNLRYHLPECDNCKVHKGFYEYFLNTLVNIHSILEAELNCDNYELIFLGHSMGGSIALFLALHYLDLGYDKLTLVTMGQPLIGNKNFANWVDFSMGSLIKPEHNSFSRKYFRIIHKNDIITTLPNNDKILNPYHQFNNQIYLNCSASKTVPLPSEVIDCVYGDNSYCIKNDFSSLAGTLHSNYYESHNTYFRRMGLCGIMI